MRRVYVTLVGRVDKPQDAPEDVGELVVIDWDTKTVQERLIVGSGKDVVLGRSRGATGVAWLNGYIYVSCREGLIKVTPDSFEQEVLDLDIPSGLHQVVSYNGMLYLTGTSENCLAVIKDDELVEKNHLYGDKSDSLHFNSIAWDSKGDQYHLYMGNRHTAKMARKEPSRIVNFTTGNVVHGYLGSLPHDLCFTSPSRLLYTVSGDGELRFIDLETRERGLLFKKPMESDPQGSYRLQGFLRGLAFHEGTNTLLVGKAPGTLYELNATTGEELDAFEFKNSIGTAVYDVILDPRDWDLLPEEAEVMELVAPVGVLVPDDAAVAVAPKKSWTQRLAGLFRRKKT